MARHKVGNVDDWPVVRTSDLFIAWCPKCHHGYPDKQALGYTHCIGSKEHPHKPTKFIGALKLRGEVPPLVQGKIKLGYLRLKLDPEKQPERHIQHDSPLNERIEENERLKCDCCGLTFGPYYWEDGEVCPTCGGHLHYNEERLHATS